MTKKLFLKQARSYVKAAPDMKYSAERNYFEYKAIKELELIWGKGIVPEILYYDKTNYVIVMSDLREVGRVLALDLKAGNVPIEIGVILGKQLGILHNKTYKQIIYIRDPDKDNLIRNFNYNFRTEGAKKYASETVAKLIEESKKAARALILGDCASKNIFVGKYGARLYDFENVHMGDPAWDVGFVLGHFMLEAAYRPEIGEKVLQVVSDFIKNYSAELKEKDIATDLREILKRATCFMGATMLHRIAGGAGKGKDIYIKYIGEENLEKIEALAVDLLKWNYESPIDAVKALR